MAGSVTQTAADTFKNVQFSTPIPRLQTKGNHATVMELLWIDMRLDGTLNAVNESLSVSFYGGVAATSAGPGISDTRTIANVTIDGGNVVTSGSVWPKESTKYNLQSKDGYGYLFGGDIINVGVASANTGATNACYFRIYYRFVDIPITEFIGLVQSQQQGTTSS